MYTKVLFRIHEKACGQPFILFFQGKRLAAKVYNAFVMPLSYNWRIDKQNILFRKAKSMSRNLPMEVLEGEIAIIIDFLRPTFYPLKLG